MEQPHRCEKHNGRLHRPGEFEMLGQRIFQSADCLSSWSASFSACLSTRFWIAGTAKPALVTHEHDMLAWPDHDDGDDILIMMMLMIRLR